MYIVIRLFFLNSFWVNVWLTMQKEQILLKMLLGNERCVCVICDSVLSLKIEVVGGNEKAEGGVGGLAYCYIVFQMQK